MVVYGVWCIGGRADEMTGSALKSTCHREAVEKLSSSCREAVEKLSSSCREAVEKLSGSCRDQTEGCTEVNSRHPIRLGLGWAGIGLGFGLTGWLITRSSAPASEY
jgi:hypothetical protein